MYISTAEKQIGTLFDNNHLIINFIRVDKRTRYR